MPHSRKHNNPHPTLWSSKIPFFAAQPTASNANTLGTTPQLPAHTAAMGETIPAALPATPQEPGLLTCVGKIEGHADGGVVLGGDGGVRGVEEHPIRPQQCLHLLL